MSESQRMQQALQMRARAYRQLLSGSESLLEGDRLYWTEKLLLSLLRELSRRRLQQLGAAWPQPGPAEEAPAALRESMIEAMAEAALGGHELSQWETVENGYQARCSLCGMTSWLGPDGLRYSILEDECPGQMIDDTEPGDGR